MKETAYLIQATLVSLWWIGLLLYPDFYSAFQYPNISQVAFNSFMLPDLFIIACLSVLRAYNQKRAVEFVILGGFGFATLYCVNATILTGGGFLPTTVMILGLAYNIFLIAENRMFRVANTNSTFVNLIKTVIQVLCIWIITLALFPFIILNSFGIEIPKLVNLNLSGFIIFTIFSLLGIYSAFIMVKSGKGTPLPLDQTQILVTNGPYKFVRNPMAIAGVGQGIAISIMLGSTHIFIYSLLGALLWQFVVRPIEEKDMINRFGKAYLKYKTEVNCWFPKLNNDIL